MKRLTALLIGFYLFASAAGCITELNVKKVPNDVWNKGKANGYYYSLPIPYLIVKPKGDGTMDVEVEYLPDPDHQYAVSGWSFLGFHQLTVEVEENGLLKKIVWDADDSAVAAQLAGSAANVGAAKITADGEAKKAEATKLETRAKELAAKLDEAEKARNTAQVEYDVALAELKIVEELLRGGKATDADLRAAKLKVVAAEVRRDAAREAAEAVAVGQTFNKPGSSTADTERKIQGGDTTQAQALNTAVDEEIKKFGQAWGPVWYEIKDYPNLIPPSLELVEVQRRQLSAPSAGPPEQTPKQPPEFKLSITKPTPGVIDLPMGVLAKITIEANRDLVAAPSAPGDVTLKDATGKDITSTNLLLITADSKRSLTVDIARTTPTGTYILSLDLNIGSVAEPEMVHKDVKIVINRS